MLPHVAAIRYVTPLREGGSLPGLMEADDLGTYVVKFRGAGQGRKALIAEIVSARLARACGLAVPDLVTVDVDPALAPGEPDQEVQDLLRASPGLNLGVDYLPGALDWATAGVELCLQGEPEEAGHGDHGGRPAPGPAGAGTDRSELRLLLSLRYRIRNDLGLAEDDYDKLLDEMPSESGAAGESGADGESAAAGPVAAERAARTASESDAASRSTRTTSPSAMAPESKPRAS